MDFITVELVFVAIAYAVGTLFGRYIGFRRTLEDSVEATIDSLIEQGYIKTEGYGENMEIVKWQDWCNKYD